MTPVQQKYKELFDLAYQICVPYTEGIPDRGNKGLSEFIDELGVINAIKKLTDKVEKAIKERTRSEFSTTQPSLGQKFQVTVSESEVTRVVPELVRALLTPEQMAQVTKTTVESRILIKEL